MAIKIGSDLYFFRRRHHLTQVQAGLLLGVTRATIGHWEAADVLRPGPLRQCARLLSFVALAADGEFDNGDPCLSAAAWEAVWARPDPHAYLLALTAANSTPAAAPAIRRHINYKATADRLDRLAEEAQSLADILRSL